MGVGPPGQEGGDRHLPIPNLRSSADARSSYSRNSDWMQVEPNEVSTPQDLVEYWRAVSLHKFLILRFASLGVLLALVFSFLQRPIYRAHTSIAIQDLNENFLNLKEDPTAINRAESSESYFQTQVQILQSESLLERVVEKPAIAHALTQGETQNPRIDWRAFFGLPEVVPPRNRQQVVENLASRLMVRSSGQTRLVQVYFEDGDPRLAADFSNTLVNEFVEQSHQMRWESTQQTAEWLAAHLNGMKSNLETAEAQLQAYARSSGLVFSEKGNIAEEKLRQVQEEYSKAQVERAEKQARYETALNKPLESLPEALDDPTLREFGLKLAALQQEKAQLTSELTPAHYRVRQVQAQIDELKSALETQRANVVRRTANEYHSARRREKLLATAYDQQAKTVSEQAQKAIHYDTLRHDVDASRQLYEALVQRVKQAGLAAAMRASNILIVDKAKPPLLPYRPNYPLNSALGLLIGMFFGTGLCLLRERLNRRIVAPGVAPSYLNVPELGAIPKATEPAFHLSKLFQPEEKSPGVLPGLSGNWERGNGSANASLVAAHSEQTIVTEAFRAALTSILLPTLDDVLLPTLEGLSRRVIVLTSPGPGAGKTTVTSNLGIAMAEIGRRVLLVDADLRRPRLNQVFRLSNSWGLCDLLRADDLVENHGIFQMARHSDVSGLDVLTSGDARGNPTYLLYSPRFGRLLSKARREYDLVLIDAPPAIQLADARVLGRLADGVILVIHAGRTTREGAAFCCQRFAEDGARVLGTILNSWDLRRAVYVYGNDYRYQHGGDEDEPH
jgi:polysaccharide biosynthesis transport protein